MLTSQGEKKNKVYNIDNTQKFMSRVENCLGGTTTNHKQAFRLFKKLLVSLLIRFTVSCENGRL